MKKIGTQVQSRYDLKTYVAVGECTIKIPMTMRTVKGIVYEDGNGNIFAMEAKEFEKTFKAI